MTNRMLLVLLLAFSAHANAALVCGNDTYSEHGQWYVGQDPDVALGSIDTTGTTVPITITPTQNLASLWQKYHPAMVAGRRRGIHPQQPVAQLRL